MGPTDQSITPTPAAMAAATPTSRISGFKPAITRVTEQLLNPVLGKSLVVYATKPVVRGGSWSLEADERVGDEQTDQQTDVDETIVERESVDASA